MSTSTTVHKIPWIAAGIGAGIAGLVLVAVVMVQYADDATGETRSSATTEEPAHVEHVKGSDIARVTLTKAAAERIDVQTAPSLSGAGSGASIVVPYGALLYGADGKTWVYTSPDELVFERAPIKVMAIRGERVLARSGPQPGTDVVVVGGAQLWGAEFGVGH